MIPAGLRQAKWGWVIAAGLAPPLVASILLWLVPTLTIAATAGAAWWAARTVRGGLRPVHGLIIGFIAASVGAIAFGGNDLMETIRFVLTIAAGWLGVFVAGKEAGIRPWQQTFEQKWEPKGEGTATTSDRPAASGL